MVLELNQNVRSQTVLQRKEKRIQLQIMVLCIKYWDKKGLVATKQDQGDQK